MILRVFLGLFLAFVTLGATQISIATYNVENLFDCVEQGSEYRDFKKNVYSCDDASKKLARVREVILSLNSDIIALQEIENEQILKALVSNTPYKFISFTSTKGAPVGLGLISKIRPKKSKIYKVPNVKTRNILKVEFDVGGKNFSIFINHFPAYKNGISAQKKAERTLRAALENEKNAIVLGDFNTPYGSRSLLNDIIRTKNYVDLWQFLKPSERYSRATAGRKSALDHVLLSPELMRNGDVRYVDGSFEIYKPEFILDENGYAKRQNGRNLYSDHFALRFKISL